MWELIWIEGILHVTQSSWSARRSGSGTLVFYEVGKDV